MDSINAVLHVVFLFLPLCWIAAFLPSWDAMFSWFGEQWLVHVHGGTPVATEGRLYMQLLVTWCGFGGIYVLYSQASPIIGVFCAIGVAAALSQDYLTAIQLSLSATYTATSSLLWFATQLVIMALTVGAGVLIHSVTNVHSLNDC